MNKGFTLILSVLISSIVLAIGLSMYNISVKQTLLSYTARESHFAFYAADAGLECAQYWEYINDHFTTTKGGAPLTDIIDCNGGNVTVVYTTTGGAGVNYIREFTLNLGTPPDAPCAVVTVTKTNTPSTIMESRGYNTCDTNNPRRTERAIRITQ